MPQIDVFLPTLGLDLSLHLQSSPTGLYEENKKSVTFSTPEGMTHTYPTYVETPTPASDSVTNEYEMAITQVSDGRNAHGDTGDSEQQEAKVWRTGQNMWKLSPVSVAMDKAKTKTTQLAVKATTMMVSLATRGRSPGGSTMASQLSSPESNSPIGPSPPQDHNPILDPNDASTRPNINIANSDTP